MTPVLFDGDDRSYFHWLHAHPSGFVVNLRRHSDPDYVVLHRASCASVNTYRGMNSRPGGFTERAYRKLCGASSADLVRHLSAQFGRPDPITKRCSRCSPE
jgi:hypothetical protein